jgi:hypothetical protein
VTASTIIDRRERRTEIRDGVVIQYLYSDEFAQRRVEERITTSGGQSLRESFDTPLSLKALPELPLAKLARAARDARLAGLGLLKPKKVKRKKSWAWSFPNQPTRALTDT